MNETGVITRSRGLVRPPSAGDGAGSRRRFAVLVGVALVLGLGLRTVGLDRRPMHHDEANQAVKFGVLLETGAYRYDRTDHHGPTLYYLTLPVAWLRGQATLASLDERTVRIVPALFGTGLLVLFLSLTSRLGRGAVAGAVALAAVSPALVYYSRFYIQESLFAFLAIGCLIAIGRYGERQTLAAALTAGASVGLAYATKETAVIVVPAAVAAVAIARHLPSGPGGHRMAARMMDSRRWLPPAHLAAGAAAALAVAWLFFSSFGTHPDGFVDSIRAFGVFVDRGTGTGSHSQPWYHYLGLLAWSSSGGLVWTEAAILILAAGGLVSAGRPTGTYWQRVVALYSVLTTLIFSLVSYKTPWNLLPFYAGIVLLAGMAVQALLDRLWGQIPEPERRHRNLTPKKAATTLVIATLLAACAHLGWQSWQASTRYGADPRNPYAYLHTSPDLLRLVQRVADLSALHPDRDRMLIRVVAGPYEQWPLPWYLRRMPRVGYWLRAAEAGPFDGTPVIIASQANAAALEATLGDRYIAEMYGLRPEVFLTVFIERGLWERFLATRH
jgi:uncharacterized protein (TIGR03663 family)